tara:strand:- start:148 stop:1197 length:1050 start_codon:yes stop_codon:yes gene_type:complete
MLGTYFYHEILRRTVISFGTVFNDIHIRHKNSSGGDISDMRVPLAYGPMQKFLARIEQQPDLNRATQMTLPRMSFETTDISYDPTRKASITQTFKASDGTNLKKVYMPVPYNVGFELNIMVKLNDDALQIVEQILPYFQPSFNLTVDLVDSIGEKRDIPVVLDNISFEDDYEGDFSTRRALIYTLNFTAKTYLFGPIADTTDGLIKKVQVDYFTSVDRETARRQLRYTATPKALQDYNDDNTTVLKADLSKSKTKVEVGDSGSLVVGGRIIIDTEVMKVKEIVDAQTIVVYRGYDNTVKATHITGTSIDALTAADDVLVEADDDFGFNGVVEDFTDGGTWSPTRQTDLT